MTGRPTKINFPSLDQQAFTLCGRLKNYSTKELHTHAFHQLLVIWEGVSLLVDQTRKQPLFGSMAAFIPAQFPHRSLVVGQTVSYKSLYLAPSLFESIQPEISIFEISSLGSALFDRITIKPGQDTAGDLMEDCLNLLLKVLREDITRTVKVVRLPEPAMAQNKRVMEFIEKNFRRRLTMADFQDVFSYSPRHAGRLFKADLKITVFEYLRLYRILRASVALSDSERAITEVAFDSGYESLSSFYRDFHHTFAVTPKVFRQQRSGQGTKTGVTGRH